MSLSNQIKTPPTISTGGIRKKYTVNAADLVALGAFTTGVVTLDNLPAGSVLYSNRIKHNTAVAGTSFSASTARLSFDGTALGSGALDVFAAVGATAGTHLITGVTPIGSGNVAATIPLIMTVTSTGGNLAATTAGSIDAWIDYSVLL